MRDRKAKIGFYASSDCRPLHPDDNQQKPKKQKTTNEQKTKSWCALTMKIFAKRKKKAAAVASSDEGKDPNQNGVDGTAKDQNNDKAEQAVLELLKMDPATLNAKQRRMIKRYRARNPDDPSPASEGQPEVETEAVAEAEPSVKTEPKSEAVVASSPVHVETKEALSREEDNNNDNNSNDDEDDQQNEDQKDVEQVDESKKSEDDVAEDSITNDATTEKNSTVDANDKDEVDKQKSNPAQVSEEKVRKLLEELNSKQRRKLVRKLDREGASVLAEVHEEAIQLIQGKEADEAKEEAADAQKEKAEESKAADTTKNSKTGKKKKKQDWSSLSPEERMRREEQRRLQKEAADRRQREAISGKGTNKGYKHPLNSERRRANRRKPKWDRKRLQDAPPNEHDTSGFHMRKLQKRY